MKIGIIAPGIWGTVFLDNARSLVRLGHEVAVYTDDPRAPSARRFTRIREDGIEFYVIHHLARDPLAWLPDKLAKRWLGRRFFTTLLAVYRFIKATSHGSKDGDCDVYLVENDWMGVFTGLAGKLLKFRWVVGIHDTDHLRIRLAYPGRPDVPLLQKAKSWVLERCDAVRANSFVTRDALVEGGCAAAKIEVIPLHIPSWMWVNEALEPFRAAARAEVFAKHALPADTRLFITMCRLAPVKGLELAVETLAGVMKTHPSARLMICGGDRDIPGMGSYQAALQKLATQLGVADRVIFPGNLDIHVVKRYLAAADVHLAPSMVDTFNYAVIEDGLAGTPTLASTAVGAGPWMADAGAGSVVADRAAASWTAAANALLTQPPTLEQRQRAADKLATVLHPDAVTARLVDLLARTAGRKA